jgi:hypothetical protein
MGYVWVYPEIEILPVSAMPFETGVSLNPVGRAWAIHKRDQNLICKLLLLAVD